MSFVEKDFTAFFAVMVNFCKDMKILPCFPRQNIRGYPQIRRFHADMGPQKKKMINNNNLNLLL